jgi:hypothetical protein
MAKLKNVFVMNEVRPMNPHDKTSKQRKIRQQNPDEVAKPVNEGDGAENLFGNYEAAIAKVQDSLVSAQKGLGDSLVAIEGQEPLLRYSIEKAMAHISAALGHIRKKKEMPNSGNEEY